MLSANDLKQLLFSINHKSYPAYKSTRGAYQFPRYTLSIDHVQGDPVRCSVAGQRPYQWKNRRISNIALRHI